MSYRSVPIHLCQSDAFRELSLEAKGLLLTLLLHCPYTGLNRFAPGVLAIHANAAPDQFASALRQLEADGWIITDGNAVFIVDVLGWQSNYQATNKNHRPNVERSIAAIRSQKLIEAFWVRYPEWRTGLSMAAGTTSTAIPSGWSGNLKGNAILEASPRDRVSTEVPADWQADQVQAPVPEEEVEKKTNSKHAGATTDVLGPTEYARSLAAIIDREQSADRVGVNNSRGVKADAAAAADLQAAGVPLSFATAVAAEVASTFKPTPDSPRIVSTRYINGAILDRWRVTGLTGLDSPTRTSVRRRSFRDDERAENDRALNKDPRVNATVREQITKLNAAQPGSGDAWLAEMKAFAQAQDRYVFPFAYEWLRSRRGCPGAS